MFVEIMKSHKSHNAGDVEDELMLSNDLLASTASNPSLLALTHGDDNGGDGEENKKRNRSAFFLDERLKNSWSKSDWWKVQLGKYLRVTIKEARLMGLHIPENIYNELAKAGKRSLHLHTRRFSCDLLGR